MAEDSEYTEVGKFKPHPPDGSEHLYANVVSDEYANTGTAKPPFDPQIPQTSPVATGNLSHHIASYHAENDKLFHQEYKVVRGVKHSVLLYILLHIRRSTLTKKGQAPSAIVMTISHLIVSETLLHVCYFVIIIIITTPFCSLYLQMMTIELYYNHLTIRTVTTIILMPATSMYVRK